MAGIRRSIVRHALLALGIAGVAVLSTVSADTSAASRLRSLKSLRAKIKETEDRLADLVVKATQDNRITKIEKYLSFTEPEQFVRLPRDVTAKNLVDWMSDEKAPAELRQMAKDALINSTARSMNPDLQAGQKNTKRAAFASQFLVPLLKDKEDSTNLTNKFADEALRSFYYPSATFKDIAHFNAQDPTTWDKAATEWKKFLAGK